MGDRSRDPTRSSGPGPGDGQGGRAGHRGAGQHKPRELGRCARPSPGNSHRPPPFSQRHRDPGFQETHRAMPQGG